MHACSGAPHAVPDPAQPRTRPEVALPTAPGAFAPAQTRTAGAPAEIADVDGCETCHGGVAAQFRSSAHAWSSLNNPAYRYTFDRLRTEVGKRESRFCAGCHDVSLLVEGAIDGEVRAEDPRAHAGITCRTCHSITGARTDGNASHTLTAAPIPLPKKDDPASLDAHRKRVRPIDGAVLCGSCHRALLGQATGNAHHLAGADDLGPMSRSAFAGSAWERIDDPVEKADCRGCHMPLEPADDPVALRPDRGGRVRSHRFLGGHTWLAAMRGDRAQLEATQALLRKSASIDVAAVVWPDGRRALPAETATLQPGDSVRLDVVVRSLGVGHRFPGGTLDVHDTWLEVVVTDALGRRVAEAGALHAADEPDATAHVLAALVADGDGRPQRNRETHRFQVVTANHTLPPREAAVVGYTLEVPASAALPLTARARLRHRSRSATLRRATCEESRTARGRELTRASERLLGTTADGCVPAPITELATATVVLGGRATGSPAANARRLLDHARGLLRGLQERREEARPSLERALALATAAADPGAQAMAWSLLAELAADQARPDEAIALCARAEAITGPHPALDRIRASAYEAVWRWAEAVPLLARVTEASPRATDAWAHLAIARQAAGDAAGALAAARRGLAGNPRHPDLLRVQALALLALGDPRGSEAEAASLAFRTPDEAQAVIERCTARDAECARERTPVHTHALEPPPARGAR